MPILKAVIDTSVMVSVAFAVQGLAKELRGHDSIRPVFAGHLQTDPQRALPCPALSAHRQAFSPTKEDINAFMALIIERALIVEGLYEINGLSADPNDDMFIACTLEADADHIISRDPHLKNIKHYRRIQIIDATTFIEKVKGK